MSPRMCCILLPASGNSSSLTGRSPTTFLPFFRPAAGSYTPTNSVTPARNGKGRLWVACRAPFFWLGAGIEESRPQPRTAPGVERLHLGALQAGHVGLHREADLRLQIAKVAVAVGEALQQRLVER